jgi:hypothetical protein
LREDTLQFIRFVLIASCVALAVVFGAPSAQAQNIGFGYQCSGKVILLRGKKVTATRATANLQTQSKQVKAQGGKSAATKLAALKKAVSSVKACAAGRLGPVIPPALKTLLGTFSSGSFSEPATGLSGTLQASFSLDGTIFRGNITVSSPQFEAAFGTKEIILEADLKGLRSPLVISFPQTPLGNLALSFSEENEILLQGVGLPRNEITRALGISLLGILGEMVGNQFVGKIDLIGSSGSITGGELVLTR